MRISFSNLKAFLANVNARSENHGEEKASAGDLKFEATVPNTFLDQLHATLRTAFFFMDSAVPKDLADQGMEEGQHWPHLRFPNIKDEISWEDEMAGGILVIHHGLGGLRSDLELKDIKVNNLRFTPMAGGLCEVSFRVQAHPDEKQFGKLCGTGMIQSEVEISVKPPEASAQSEIA